MCAGRVRRLCRPWCSAVLCSAASCVCAQHLSADSGAPGRGRGRRGLERAIMRRSQGAEPSSSRAHLHVTLLTTSAISRCAARVPLGSAGLICWGSQPWVARGARMRSSACTQPPWVEDAATQLPLASAPLHPVCDASLDVTLALPLGPFAVSGPPARAASRRTNSPDEDQRTHKRRVAAPSCAARCAGASCAAAPPSLSPGSLTRLPQPAGAAASTERGSIRLSNG